MAEKIEGLYNIGTIYPEISKMKSTNKPLMSETYYAKALSVITDLKITRKNINHKMSKIKGRHKQNKKYLDLLSVENTIDLALNNIYTFINKDFEEYGTGKIDSSTLNAIFVHKSLIDID